MEQLKPRISDSYEQWAAKHPELVNSPARLQELYGSTISPVVKSRAAKPQDSIHDHYANTRSAGAVPVSDPSTGPPPAIRRYSPWLLGGDGLAGRVQQLSLGPRSSSMASQQAAPLGGPSQDAALSSRVAEAMKRRERWQQEVAEEVKRKQQERVMYEQQKIKNRHGAQESAIAAAKQAAELSRVAEAVAKKRWQQDVAEEVKKKEQERIMYEQQKVENQCRAQESAITAAKQAADLSRVAEAVEKKRWQQDVAEEVMKEEQERIMYEQQKIENQRRAQESAITAAKQAATMSVMYPNVPRSSSAQGHQAQAQPGHALAGLYLSQSRALSDTVAGLHLSQSRALSDTASWTSPPLGSPTTQPLQGNFALPNQAPPTHRVWLCASEVRSAHSRISSLAFWIGLLIRLTLHLQGDSCLLYLKSV